MEIIRSKNDGVLTLKLEGRLDTATAPQLDAVLGAEADAEKLILDFEKLDYISSAGLRVLLQSEKRMSARGGMKLVGVNEAIMGIFEMTGFADILTIE